jgi:lamin tail-like protein
VIVNDGSSSVVVTGWTLRDRDDALVFRFPAFTLRPGARVTVHNGRGSNNAANLYWDSDGYVWNNDGVRDAPSSKRSRVNVGVYSGSGQPQGAE